MKKTVMITGASRGIGKGIAIEFAKDGYDLVLTCKNSKDKIKKLAKDLESRYSVSCYPFVADMSKKKDVDKLFEDISNLDVHVDIDVLINNAGISYIGLLSDMSYEDWNSIISTNLTATFLCSQKVIPNMLATQKGKIINISSVWGNVGASMEVAYSASKAGLNGFTKALAKELAPSNIQVNAIACGLIDTDMNKCFSTEDLNVVIEEIPADRMGNVDEVGKLALQLATGNEYLTGQIISLDGGWM